MTEDDSSLKEQAVVTEVRLESPTVKGITLRIDNPGFAFKAGQWVDMFIPGIETIAGYSMCSSPKNLRERRFLDLAIQYSEWPPTLWIHDKCQVNSKVEVRVGGKTYYDPEGDGAVSATSLSQDLLLIAGGVGINPLASIFFHANDLHKAHSSGDGGYRPGKVILLQSAKSTEELLFKSKLDSLSRENSNLEVKYFVTRNPAHEGSSVINGHITSGELRSALESLDASTVKTFVCGPAKMIDDIEEILLNLGLDKSQIVYEKWW